MSFANYLKTADFKTEKHVPVIELPESVKSGVAFKVEVSVGKEIPHPNVTEHYISSIALYFMPDGGKFVYEIGKVDFMVHGESTEGPNKGPVHSDPVSTFTVKTTQPGTLTAVSYCNIHGVWESSVRVDFK